jgi:hypothetical protein
MICLLYTAITRQIIAFILVISDIWLKNIAFRDQSAEIINSSDIDTDFVHGSVLPIESEEDIVE